MDLSRISEDELNMEYSPITGAKAESSDIIKLIAFLVVSIIVLLLLLPYIVKQLFSSSKDVVVDVVADVVDVVAGVVLIPGKVIGEKLSTQSTKMELYTGQATGSYQAYVADMGLVQQVLVQAGNVITPSEVLIAAAEKGMNVGMGYNEQRGTLSVIDVPAYNLLGSDQRLAYNQWAAEKNTGKTGFYYAPSIESWKTETGGQASIMSVPFALWKGVFG